MGKANENQMRSKGTLRTTQQYIERLNLPMKLINAHHAFDGKMIVIQFSAEGRVDFRELVKLLSQEFNTRIELRQIGVRDETGIYGGIGVCGQMLCCSRFLKEFNSINVKMAKEQDLSLTPATISGACGRLKCCLKYEHDGYTELAKGMPRKGEFCETPDGPGRITDRNLLTGKVFVTMENGNVNQYSVDTIKVVQNHERKNPQAPKKNQERPKNGKNAGDEHPHNNSKPSKYEGKGEKNKNNPKHHAPNSGNSEETGSAK
jgi:cell fate regulator YaaT (PSP1 superfamily)